MFTFFHQLQDLVVNLRMHYFLIFLLFIWTPWLVKFLISRFYRPHGGAFCGTASVVIPVVDEDPGLFEQVLRRIADQQPHEVIVVINGPRNEALEHVCDTIPGLQRLWLPAAGKRNAIAQGAIRATGAIAVFVDSDSLWEPNALVELLKPFADARIGGTTIEQRIWQPERSFWTRFADWIEEMRMAYGMPAMSVFRMVGCLPGRTVAFRREIVLSALPDFLNGRFLGTHMEESDDRALTNHCLREGYRTVVQRSGLVLTDAPTTFQKFVRQQLRWARGSQYNTLRMLPWMLRHAWFLGLVYVWDTLMPFFCMGVLLNAGWKAVCGHWGPWMDLNALEQIVLAVAGGTAGWMIRRPSRLWDYPIEILYLPAYWFFVSFLLAPLRIWGFMGMAFDAGWGTRKAAYQGTGNRSPLRWVPVGIALALLSFFVALGPLLEQIGRRAH